MNLIALLLSSRNHIEYVILETARIAMLGLRSKAALNLEN
jgi:hypothetical protein